MDDAERDDGWMEIIGILGGVGRATGNEGVDYFSSLVPRHVRSYGTMMGEEYDVGSVTVDELRADWNKCSVVDVLDRLVQLDDNYYRRGVRIITHFLDVNALRGGEGGPLREEHGHRLLRFDFSRLVGELRELRVGGSNVDYDEALEKLRSFE
jgi:hypothetical protein